MEIYEINALLENKKKPIGVPVGIRNYFDVWKEHLDDLGLSSNELAAFIAGYTIGINGMLKEKVIAEHRLKSLRDKEVDYAMKEVNK